MCFLNRGSGSLPAMADHAAKLIRRMRDHRMAPVRLCAYVHQTGFLLPHVASGAAIDSTKFRQPYLLKTSPKMALQSHGITAPTNHSQIALLIMSPFTKMIFRRSDSQRHQE